MIDVRSCVQGRFMRILLTLSSFPTLLTLRKEENSPGQNNLSAEHAAFGLSSVQSNLLSMASPLAWRLIPVPQTAWPLSHSMFETGYWMYAPQRFGMVGLVQATQCGGSVFD